MKPNTFNPNTLKEIVGENKLLILKVLGEVLKGCEATYDTMIHNFEHENWNSLKANAHFLKSNFRYLGNQEMVNILKSIENLSPDEGKRHEIPNLITKFKAQYPPVMAELELYIEFLKK